MSAQRLIHIDPQDLRLGVPVDVDIFDSEGMLLLAQGASASSIEWVECLRHTGFKRANPRPTLEPVFLRIQGVADQLAELEYALQAGTATQACEPTVKRLAQCVIDCCTQDANAALAQAYLDYHHPYSSVHSLLVAVIAASLARERSRPEQESLVAAALTHDLGLLEIRSALENTPLLTTLQRSSITLHPLETARLLKDLGVSDTLWLSAIREHHEHLDGSGYPNGLRLLPESGGAVLAVADAIAAMMRTRPYRQRKLGPAIMQELRREASTRYDAALVERAVTHIGPYHAGCIVRLANHTMAVVTRHLPDQPDQPELLLIATFGDQPMEKPYPIDRYTPECAIVAALHPEVSLSFRAVVNRSWGA